MRLHAPMIGILLLTRILINGQEPGSVYVCPMDPEVRSSQAGKCARCGMLLAQSLPDLAEYQMDTTVTPRPIRIDQPATLTFTVRDPWKQQPVTRYQVIHEKLFHLFAVGQDLQFFRHDHPVQTSGGQFQIQMSFPKPGIYRLLGDFLPDGGVPQLITNTVAVPGTVPSAPRIEKDYSSKTGPNLRVHLAVLPNQPVAGRRSQLQFRIEPAEGLERYLGAWAHMLAVSDDLIDLMHEHPTAADGGSHLLFSTVFPRARPYRIWIQIQRAGIVNTVHFDVVVKDSDEE